MQSGASFPNGHGSFQRGVAHSLLVVFLATLPGSPPIRAEIAGEQVISGDVTFQQQGDVTTIHASDGAIIHYDQLDVWAHEELHFVQPDSQARVLNRVFGDATHIDGGLFANGIVYIVNPAGIFFGGSAVVDVAGLVAAAGNISNDDFLAGTDHFELTGRVINAGQIDAGSVALLGTSVANHGSIRAPDGTIALVAGEQVVLTRLGGHLYVEVEGTAGDADTAAIEQTGSVDAGAGEVSFTTGDVYSLAINHDGITRGRTIELRAASGTVSVAGLLDASDRSAGATGGSIAVTGERIALLGAELDASGDAGGGTIRVGGDLRGEGTLPAAKRTFVNGDSVLRADAIGSGDGGRVIVWADEATAFHGALSARGGAAGGDGGFAEISGAVFLWSDGDVDLRAVSGANGTLLYDPKDIVLAGGTVDGDDNENVDAGELDQIGRDAGQILFGDPDELTTPFTIYESEIEGTDANVVLEATNSITTSGAGTFVNDTGEGVDVLRISDGNSLTMRTRNSAGDATGSTTAPGINLAGLSLLTTGGAVTLSTGDGNVAVAGITTRGDAATGGPGGAVTLTAGGDGSVTAGAIDTSGGASATAAGGAGGAASLTTVDGAITVASVTTSGGAGATNGGAGGAINLSAGDFDASRDSDVTATGDLRSRGGDGGTGIGGDGGSVTVGSEGVEVPIGGTTDPIRGGGALALADVDTIGGGGATTGGRGGAVRIVTSDGAIDTGDVDTSGGDGGSRGGNAGAISVFSADANMDDANAIATGVLRAVGGAGTTPTTSAGGAGGAILVRSLPSSSVDDDSDPPVELQAATGGGDVTVESAISSGGDGGDVGGRAGEVILAAAGAHTLTAGDAATAAVIAVGGSGENGGGNGGRTLVGAGDGDVLVGAIDTRGGNAGAAGTARGGNGGEILAQAGFEEDGGGNLTLLGNFDAREGNSGSGVTDALLAGRDGGLVTLIAGDDLEHAAGMAGPHVRTTGDVTLTSGGNLGATGQFLIEGSGESRTNIFGNTVDDDTLTVSAAGRADVQVTNAGFLRSIEVTATDVGADIDVTQSGGDVIDMAGVGGQMVVTTVDTTGNAIDAVIRLDSPEDALTDDTLVIATGPAPGVGSVTAGGSFDALSDGDLVVGNGDGVAITASAVPGPNAGRVALFADADADGSGAIFDAPGSDTGRIDMLAGADQPGQLDLEASSGIGTAADFVTVIGGGRVSALNTPLKANDDPDFDPEDPSTGDPFIPDPGAMSGIFVRNTVSGDLTVGDIEISAGSGDIGITNEAGDLTVAGPVSAKPENETDGAGGDVTFRVLGSTSQIVLDTPSTIRSPFAVESGGMQIYDGDVALARNTDVRADGGLEIRGDLDSLDTATRDADFNAALGDGTTLAVDGGVGANRKLLSFGVFSTVADGEVTLDLPSINTSGLQAFGSDVRIAQDLTLTSDGGVLFFGDVDADPAATSSNVAIRALTVGFDGDVVLTSLDVTASLTTFGSDGPQSVTTGAGGIRIGDGGAISPIADVAKSAGVLHLESIGGAVTIGDGEKLSVAGRLELVGDTVRFTDLSAIDICVEGDVTQIFARAPGLVTLADGRQIADGGTDLLGNTVAFLRANPTVVGSGPAPRIATQSGSAQNAGALTVTTLPAPISVADIASGSRVLDLAIPTSDPGHETPELPGDAVEAPLALYASQDMATPGAPLSSAEIVAFLACAPLGDRDAPPGCAPAAPPPYGSALDTERAVEVARAYRELLGDSARARAGREALARAAADPEAKLASATSPAGRVYLTELARVLAQTRMLGLSAASYGEVRGDLLAGVVAAIGSQQLDAARLAAAVEAGAMGMPI